MRNQLLEVEPVNGALNGNGVQEFANTLRNAFTKVVSDILVKNDSSLVKHVYALNDALHILENSENEPTAELEALKVQIKEYLFIIQTYFKKNINVDFLERLEDQPYSMLILDSLKRTKATEEDLKARVLDEEATEEEVDAFEQTITFLQMKDLVENTEEGLALSEHAENLFDVYSSSKKLTNKFERVKRNQITSQNMRVNIQLLDRLEKVQHGFTVLEEVFNLVSGEIEKDELLEILSALEGEQAEVTVKQLEELQLITQFEDGLEDEEVVKVAITRTGIKVFETYKKSKQYTNKYEKIRRAASRS